ncbi:MAG TPA: glycosyltransferase [Chloroflexi bacterium]|nr:glycosyltransferase [Chloroflexota bacterium]
MRIGLISGEYPPMQGGVGDFSAQLARSLADLNHEVHVVTTDLPDPAPSTDGAPSTDDAGSADGASGVMVHRVITGWGWGCWGEIMELACEIRLDVLNVQYQAAAYGMHPAINFVPGRRERPVAVTFHDLRSPYLFPKAGPLRWWVVRSCARRAERVIVTNREDYLRLQDEMSRKRLSMIPIGSNIPPSPPPGYDRQAERARWGVGEEDVLLGYFGFLNASKGGEVLIQSLGLLVDQGVPAQLLMVGGRVGSSDPSNRAYLEQVMALIDRLGLADRVHWTGYTRPADVSAGLLATDVCVLPYRDGVSFRRGTLHACLAHGRAIVTTRPAVALEEVRDGENMLLAPPGDPAGLASCVRRLVENPALRTRLEVGARAVAADFTWERIARKTAAIFGRL